MGFRHSVYWLMGATVLALAGCASIVSKSNWPVNVTSTPPECRVVLKDKRGMEIFRGTTPTVVTLPARSGFFSGADYSLVFEKEGFEPVTVSLSSELNPWYIGNILFGGLIGFLVVDPATGAMFKLPEQVHGTLTAKQTSSLPVQGGLWVAALEDIPQELRIHLERLR
ncbi:MAG: hypothetical protein WHX93_02315 [bacterium]